MQPAVRFAGLTICVLAVLFTAAEIAFRLIAGQRLLYRTDPAIEYLPKPDQSVVQRGVRFETNALGMRSPPPSLDIGAVFRVLVLGDSVVFGHTNINQADLATTRLSTLTLGDGRRMEALNVSSPSWGPGNLLAWTETNGLLGAEAVVVVLSSHDLDDNRTFAPPDRNIYPQGPPLSVLGDWVVRQASGNRDDQPSADPRSQGDARRSLPALFQEISKAPSGACLVVHSTVDELFSLTPSAEHGALREMAAAAGLDIVYDRDFIDSPDYVDGIHLSGEGQVSLARAIMACPALSGGPMRG